MSQDFSTLPKGFTINMAHYVKRAKEVKNGFINNGDAKLKIYVDSTYGLGYFFGAFLSKGVSNLSNYRGQVMFRLTDEDPTTLYESIEDSFNIAPRFRTIDYGYEMIVYSKPIARLVNEFGSGEARHLPNKYLVNNTKYLLGVQEGLSDFEGHLEDTRDIINPRKFSPSLLKLWKSLSTS